MGGGKFWVLDKQTWDCVKKITKTLYKSIVACRTDKLTIVRYKLDDQWDVSKCLK